MAKALYGHLASNDAIMRWENERLRARVSELQAEVERLSTELAEADRALATVTAQEAMTNRIEDGSELGLRPALA